MTVVPNTAVGFLFALLVVRLKRLRLPVLSAFFLPYVLPVSVVTTASLWLLDANFGVIIELFTGSSCSLVRGSYLGDARSGSGDDLVDRRF